MHAGHAEQSCSRSPCNKLINQIKGKAVTGVGAACRTTFREPKHCGTVRIGQTVNQMDKFAVKLKPVVPPQPNCIAR